eukprot:7439729-Pyramimonas_sp.AAC.1
MRRSSCANNGKGALNTPESRDPFDNKQTKRAAPAHLAVVAEGQQQRHDGEEGGALAGPGGALH